MNGKTASLTEKYGGTNEGPNPGVLGRAALGSCLALGYAMPVAVGTSLIVIVVNSATALGARVVGGVDIDWPLILLFSVFGALGSLLGARVAARVDSRHLSLAFTILLVAVAAYVLAMNVPTLVS